MFAGDISAEMMHTLLAAALAVAAFACGVLIQFLISRGTRIRLEGEIALRDALLATEEVRAQEREAAIDSAQDSLAAAFSEIAHESLSRNSETFLQLARQKLEVHHETARAELGERQKAVETLVQPIREALENTHRQIADVERIRQEAYGSITAALNAMQTDQATLRAETGKLVSALRQPNVRGRWGEITLRRLAELAGMVDRCDFAEQVHVGGTNGDPAVRPDMVVHLPEDGQLIVDAKTPLDAYLNAMAATEETERTAHLQAHARSLAEHVRKLSGKAYFSQFRHSPEFVILFVPGDQFLAAALDARPSLLEDALRSKVLLVTPTSFVALLKVVAYGWMQFNLAGNAEVIRDLAVELHKRLGTFTQHLASAGKKLDESVAAYNNAVASLESRVMPNLKKIAELGADSGASIAQPAPIHTGARTIRTNHDDPTAEPTTVPTDGETL